MPAAILDDASATTICVDLRGSKYCQLFVMLGATDIAVTAMLLSESDTLTDANTLENGVAISGLTFAGSLPSATDDNKVYMFSFPTNGRKRYVDLTFTNGNGSAGGYVTAWANLFDMEIHNDNAASFNVAAIKRIPS